MTVKGMHFCHTDSALCLICASVHCRNFFVVIYVPGWPEQVVRPVRGAEQKFVRHQEDGGEVGAVLREAADARVHLRKIKSSIGIRDFQGKLLNMLICRR